MRDLELEQRLAERHQDMLTRYETRSLEAMELEYLLSRSQRAADAEEALRVAEASLEGIMANRIGDDGPDHCTEEKGCGTCSLCLARNALAAIRRITTPAQNTSQPSAPPVR